MPGRSAGPIAESGSTRRRSASSKGTAWASRPPTAPSFGALRAVFPAPSAGHAVARRGLGADRPRDARGGDGRADQGGALRSIIGSSRRRCTPTGPTRSWPSRQPVRAQPEAAALDPRRPRRPRRAGRQRLRLRRDQRPCGPRRAPGLGRRRHARLPCSRWETEAILLGGRRPGGAGSIECRSLARLARRGRAGRRRLKDLAYTLNTGRARPGPCRLGLVVESARRPGRPARRARRRGWPTRPAARSATPAAPTSGSEPLGRARRPGVPLPGRGVAVSGDARRPLPALPRGPRAASTRPTASPASRAHRRLPSEHALRRHGRPTPTLWAIGHGGQRRALGAVGAVSTPDRARPQARRGGRPQQRRVPGAGGGGRRAGRSRAARSGSASSAAVFERLEPSGAVARGAAGRASPPTASGSRPRSANRGPASTIAIDNCPHQVVVAGRAGRRSRRSSRGSAARG